MDMLVIGLCFTFFCLAITGLAFAAATRPQALPADKRAELPVSKEAPARFFVDRVTPTAPMPVLIPVEILLQQLENHVRLEQAAAESFIAYPTHALLHSKTTSPFLN
jgi:hypothetical protein